MDVVVLSPVNLVVFGLVSSLVAIYLWFSYIPYRVLKCNGINGPPPSIFFGNYKEFSKMREREYLKYLGRKYGKVAGALKSCILQDFVVDQIANYYIGQRPYVVVTDLEMIKAITVKDFNHFVDRDEEFPFLRNVGLPSGLLFARGDDWRKSRHVISPTFSTSKMKMMESLVGASANVLVDIIQGKAGTGKSFEAHSTFGAFTMESILSAAFGRAVDIQKGESSELTEVTRAFFHQIKAGSNFNRDFVNSIFSNFPCLKIPLFKLIINEKMVFLKNTAEEIIKQRRIENSNKHKDLLQVMIDATVEGVNGERKMNDMEIISYSITFLLAGYETTANTLTFTSYLLALHPEIQQKLQEDIDNYFESNPTSSLYQASQDIKYLDMVVNESLRLYPPGPIFQRMCTKTYEYGNITIQKGVSIKVPVIHLHTDPQYWENPEEFNPLRFSTEEKAKRPQMCYLPFGSGPRNCVGRRFALMEIKIALIELMKKISFVRSPDTEVPLETILGVTISPKNGVYIKAARRSDIQ